VVAANPGLTKSTPHPLPPRRRCGSRTSEHVRVCGQRRHMSVGIRRQQIPQPSSPWSDPASQRDIAPATPLCIGARGTVAVDTTEYDHPPRHGAVTCHPKSQ
jgi:hypothetical protein